MEQTSLVLHYPLFVCFLVLHPYILSFQFFNCFFILVSVLFSVAIASYTMMCIVYFHNFFITIQAACLSIIIILILI